MASNFVAPHLFVKHEEIVVKYQRDPADLQRLVGGLVPDAVDQKSRQNALLSMRYRQNEGARVLSCSKQWKDANNTYPNLIPCSNAARGSILVQFWQPSSGPSTAPDSNLWERRGRGGREKQQKG